MPPVYWILLLVFIILTLELASGRHRGVHRRQDFWIIASNILHSQLSRPLIALLTATVIGALLPAYRNALAAVPVWAGLPVLLVVAEFCQYWVHRSAHDARRHPWLYGMHRTHHTAPYVNVTLMYRSNLLWPLVHPYTWITALAFYLGMYATGTVFYLTMMAWNALTHSDFRWDDAVIEHVPGGRRLIRLLEYVLVTPRIHHTHHGFGRDGKTYRNFCTLFSFFDRWHGTLHIPQGRPQHYGLPGAEHHWLRQLLFPLVPLARRGER